MSIEKHGENFPEFPESTTVLRDMPFISFAHSLNQFHNVKRMAKDSRRLSIGRYGEEIC
jgi:hypothetical protein